MCGIGSGVEEYPWWMGCEVIGVEEEDVLGGEEHGEDFALVMLDPKFMTGVIEDIG